MTLGMERDLAESRAHLAEISAANAALRRANAELEASRAALAESEARLRLALDAARMATWDWDVATDETRGSEGRDALYGLPAGALRTRADVLAAVHPDDRAAAEETILRAMRRDLGEEEFDAVEFRVRGADGAVRWLRSQGRVTVRDPRTGAARRAAGVTFDVTLRRQAEQAASRALAEVRAVYDTVPAGLALLDRDGRFLSMNARLAAVLGLQREPPPAGRAPEEVLPAEVARLVRAAHRRVVGKGAPEHVNELAFAAPVAPGDRRFWTADLQPILSEPEEGRRVLAVSLMLEDVTDRRRAEAKRDLLSREVDHRARNALAVVQAAVRMTRADDVPAFKRAVEGRIAAVARAQTLLADRQWSGAGLRALAESALAAFAPDGHGGRARFAGPDIALDSLAVQPLSMALHELATNAVKHGAFAVPDGEVSVSWAIDGEAGLLRLRWAESRGRPAGGGAAPPRRRGFGTRVLQATLGDQLGGGLRQDWSGPGLVCEIALPAARVVAGSTPGR